MATSSGNVRSGSHSSKPSRQTSESSLIAPVAALRLSSLNRTGPTGTPLIPTYHSSVLELDDSTAIAAETDEGSSWVPVTDLEKAPASPAFAGPIGRGTAFGGTGRAALAGGGNDPVLEGAGDGARRGGRPAGRGGDKPEAAAWTAPFEADI